MYWVQALVQFFRRVLSVQPEDFKAPHDRSVPIDGDLLELASSRIQDKGELTRKRKSLTAAEAREKIWEIGFEKAYNSRDAIAATNGNNGLFPKSFPERLRLIMRV